jgi:hypothetical protein
MNLKPMTLSFCFCFMNTATIEAKATVFSTGKGNLSSIIENLFHQ